MVSGPPGRLTTTLFPKMRMNLPVALRPKMSVQTRVSWPFCFFLVGRSDVPAGASGRSGTGAKGSGGGRLGGGGYRGAGGRRRSRRFIGHRLASRQVTHDLLIALGQLV